MKYCHLIAALATAGFASIAHADYECKRGFQPLSAQQTDMQVRAVAAMRAALLPPPEGWTMRQPAVSPNIGSVCADFKNSNAVNFWVSVTYIMLPSADVIRRARAASRAEQAEIAALEKIPPEPQARIDAMNAEASALRKEAREMSRAGNAAGANAKTAENEALGVKIRKIRADHKASVQAASAAVRDKYRVETELNRSTQFHIELEGNGREARAYEAREGVERIQFGPGGVASDRVVRVLASISRSGTKGTAGSDIAKGLIDRNRLQALVGGTLPSLDESNAAIKQQDIAIAALDAKALEQSRMLDNEERQARQARNESATPTPSTSATRAKADSGTSTPAATPATTASAPPAAKPVPDTAKDVKDAANKLRGLFGR